MSHYFIMLKYHIELKFSSNENKLCQQQNIISQDFLCFYILSSGYFLLPCSDILISCWALQEEQIVSTAEYYFSGFSMFLYMYLLRYHVELKFSLEQIVSTAEHYFSGFSMFLSLWCHKKVWNKTYPCI